MSEVIALTADEAVRAGYSFETVMRMSPRQLHAISVRNAQLKAAALRDDATAARVGFGAGERAWKQFLAEIQKAEGA